MARFNTGDRIRAIRYDVTIDTTEGKAVKIPVTLRHAWPEGTAMPVHSCNADECDDCVEKAVLQALRLQAGEVAAVFLKQDHQATAR